MIFGNEGWIDNDYEHGDEIYTVECMVLLGDHNCVNYVFTVDLFDGQITGVVYSWEE